MTHYLPKHFAEHVGNVLLKAVCGAFVTRAAHSDEPQCADCRIWLEADAAVQRHVPTPVLQTHFLHTKLLTRHTNGVAACGRYVSERQHSATPECADCQAFIRRQDDEKDLTAEDVFGPPPESFPPKERHWAEAPKRMLEKVAEAEVLERISGYRPRGSR